METRKRPLDSSGSSEKEGQVTKETFSKWQCLYEREHASMTWLRCDVDTQKKSFVSTLWCHVCRKYEERICCSKNFSRAWIEGSSNHKTSNILDHAKSDQHKAAMNKAT